MIMKKGMVTLTALILLSGLLALILLFDEQIFAFFRAQMSQRKYYVEQGLALQKISQQQQKHICQNLPLNGAKNVAKNIEKELFGYKLNGKMIETKQTYKNAVNADCRSEECQRALTQSTCNAGGGWTDLLDEKEFEISQLRFDWLKAGKGIEIKLAGNLATHKHIQYETSLVVPLLNQEE